MIELIQALSGSKSLLYWIFGLLAAWAFYRFINSESNELEWHHFISSRNPEDGKYYADLDKAGKATGIVIGSWALITISANVKSDFVGFAALLGVYFAFVGAIAGYSAYLRSKAGVATTVTTTEPLPRGPVKTTVTETAAPPVATKTEVL